MEQDHHPNPTAAEPGRKAPSQPHADPQLSRLEKRLLEAFDELWDNFVDPAEAYYDADGSRWAQVGAASKQLGAAGLAFTTEQQLAEIRTQCRSLAVANEFAINGHDDHVRKTTFCAQGCFRAESPGKGGRNGRETLRRGAREGSDCREGVANDSRGGSEGAAPSGAVRAGSVGASTRLAPSKRRRRVELNIAGSARRGAHWPGGRESLLILSLATPGRAGDMKRIEVMPRSDFCRTALSSLKRQAESEAAKYGRLVHMLVLPEGQGVSSIGRVPQFHGRPTKFGRSEIAGRIPPDHCWPKGVEPLCAIVVSPDPRILQNHIGVRRVVERIHLFFGDEAAFRALEPVAADLLELRDGILRKSGVKYPPCLDTNVRGGAIDKWGREVHYRAWEGQDSPIHVKPKTLFRGEPIEVDPSDVAFTKYLSYSLLECDVFTATGAVIEIYLRWVDEGPPDLCGAIRSLVPAGNPEASAPKQTEPSAPSKALKEAEQPPEEKGVEVTPEDDNEDDGARESFEGESQKSTVNWKNWAVGRAQTGWMVFQRFNGRWNHRGAFDEISAGRVTALAIALVDSGGRILKTKAIDLFKRDYTGKNDKWIFKNVCIPTRKRLANQMKTAIARISCRKVKMPNPIPWGCEPDSWRCEFEIGYAPVGEDGKLRFATADQMDTEALDDILSSRKAGTMTLPEEFL